MTGKKFANRCVPEYVPSDLKWYEMGGLMTYIEIF